MTLFVVLFLIALLSAVCYYSIHRTRKAVTKLAESKKLNLTVKETISPNSSQMVTIYDTSTFDNIQKAFTTITLRSEINPYNLLFTERESSFHINLILNCKAPCFYIFNRSKAFTHPGKNFTKPYLLNKSKYSVSGIIPDKLNDFICKFDFEYFYSSYLPSNFEEKDLNANIVEIKASLNSVDEEMLTAFLQIFEKLDHEAENKYQRVIKEFELMRKQYLKNENMGFFDKVKKELSKKKKA